MQSFYLNAQRSMLNANRRVPMSPEFKTAFKNSGRDDGVSGLGFAFGLLLSSVGLGWPGRWR